MRPRTLLALPFFLATVSAAHAFLPGLSPGTTSLAPMLETVTPAVVNISTAREEVVRASPLFSDPFFRRFFQNRGRPHKRTRRGLGSGVILDADTGHIVTNHHLIARADEISVTLHDNRTYPARLIGTDQETDIAVLQIEAEGLADLVQADSSSLRVGDFVVAIGNPFGLSQTVTAGIISALDRSGVFNPDGYENFIQTDASINPGNSGGALVNLEGELIGINTAILSRSGGNIGIGFAIPMQMVRQVTEQLIEYGHVERGELGLLGQDLTPELATAFGVPAGRGIVITHVAEGSPAAKAGLRVGDVLRTINGEEVGSVRSLRAQLGVLRTGETVEISFERGGTLRTVRAATTALRIEGAELHPALAGLVLHDRTGADGGSHVAVAKVDPGSAPEHSGIREGDRVRSVNRRPVRSISGIRSSVDRNHPQVLVRLQRGKRAWFVLLESRG